MNKLALIFVMNIFCLNAYSMTGMQEIELITEASWEILPFEIKEYVFSLVVNLKSLKALKALKNLRSINKECRNLCLGYCLRIVLGELKKDTKSNREMAFRRACGSDDRFFMEQLRKTGININARDRWGRTALMIAAKTGNPKTIRWIWHNDTVRDYSGFVNALLSASASDNKKNVRYLLSSCRPLESANDTRLFHAIIHKNYNLVKALLNEKNVNETISGDFTPLMFASNNNSIDIVTLLLKFGADPNYQNDNGITAVMFSAQHGHKEILELFTKAKADLNAQENDRCTALIYAARYGHIEIIQLLIDAGANVNSHDQDSHTALISASQNGHKKTVQLLISCGANVHAQRSDKSTALTTAALNGHAEIVQILIDAGSDVNIQGINGNTALMLAGLEGYEEIVQLLINAKANVNVQNDAKWTALMNAASNGHREIVQLLIDAGADVNIQSTKGNGFNVG